jgi:hypothetical protein
MAGESGEEEGDDDGDDDDDDDGEDDAGGEEGEAVTGATLLSSTTFPCCVCVCVCVCRGTSLSLFTHTHTHPPSLSLSLLSHLEGSLKLRGREGFRDLCDTLWVRLLEWHSHVLARMLCDERGPAWMLLRKCCKVVDLVVDNDPAVLGRLVCAHLLERHRGL